MSAMLLGFALWSVYDGAVAYPAHNEKVAKFQELKDGGRISMWPAYASERGWSDEDPGEGFDEMDIRTQWVQASVTGALALAALFMIWRTYRSRLAAEPDALVGPSGQRVHYNEITEIDKERWDSKGIAIVHYESDGKKGTVKIDDWVFKDADHVLAEVENRTGLGAPI
jgi:hypothetical protein